MANTALGAEKEEIIKNIMTSPVVNIDFTNANVNGEARQVLIMASPQKNAYMYFARDSKGAGSFMVLIVETTSISSGTMVRPISHDLAMC